ncbi:Protein MODIFIER OF SNC1 [Trema orientale]|uniref:Protein MODIFIER OF SNC1 n=1 Tax=Trema orientale TaxID=63057 RepID=A0A2P5CF75_TREOI|nr:Protein MODIFIER OF SNC1 [Trema orientale]
MLSGDRRWASSSARRGGLTVLGKVVVPKPINLPSQRSENHGLDPNVEIVPKGTLSWGSRSSSAWGSSSLSPNTDGGSPSHLSGRPSSGSGTRPSTASSDRAHEPTANFSGPNSRPSSASGVLTSNQTSLVSLRPRSAETRPGSSQLSRFAEHSEHPVAWNAAGTAEKLGVTPPKNDGFSLTSGDFPTLGSGKENSGKNADLQDQGSHSRPGSSAGVATARERISTFGAGDVSTSDNVKNGAVNSWKRDDPPYDEDGGRPGMEKWQGNPQTYSAPPQHYDGWHGTPLNNPQGGVWFRGPPGGPYGNPVTPAGFPMEPFPYYRPQIPAAGLSNPQTVPPPGAGLRGPHPKNADMYRSHMPDAYIRPGMPIRPGFYAGPVAYEGYYGPPIGYCSANERDVPFMGMAAGPTVYKRYPGQNAPEPGNSHGRPSGYGSSNQTLIGEQVESGHPQDTRGPYKVLLKQHDDWDRKTEEQRSEGVVAIDASREDQQRTSSWENDWRSDHEEAERDLRKAPGEEASSQNFDNQGATSVPVKMKSPGRGNVKAVDDISGKKLESEAFGLSKVPQPLPAGPKDSSLIQKIEGLNAKARASDGRNETVTSPKNKFQANAKASQNRNESAGGSLYPERTYTTETINPDSHEVGMSAGDNNLDSTSGPGTNISRRSTNPAQSRGDHYGKGRSFTQESEGWQKKPSISESPAVVSAVHLDTSNVHVHDHHRSTEATENSGSLPHGKLEGQSVLPMFDRSDNQAQRAKMKELAKQRTKQLQEEEEERTKKQLAKARAKLEELNRRTQAVEESTQKLENASSGTVQDKQEESHSIGESSMAGSSNWQPKTALGSKPNVVAQINESYTSGVEKSCLPCSEQAAEACRSVSGEPQRTHAQSVPLQQEVNVAKAAHHGTTPHVQESNVSKQKRTGLKQKQATRSEVPETRTDVENNVTTSLGVVANEVLPSGGSVVPVNSNANADSSLHPRKKNSKNGKNKHKLEDASVVSSSLGSKENHANVSLDSAQPMVSESQLDPSAPTAVQLQTISRDADRPSEQHPISPNADSHGRVNSQWKPQQSRRMPRNPQGNRPTEKFHGSDAVVWAPVRSHNKSDVTDEASHKNLVDGVTPSVKSDHQVQNKLKNKRAEMERYVPKPVAKEMAQHGGNNHPVTYVVNQTTSDESLARAGSESSHNTGMVAGKTGSSAEPRNGSSRHNKQGKAHGSWRQRGSTEATSPQGLQDGQLYTANLGQNVQKPNEHHHPQRPDASSVKEQQKFTDEWSTTDNWGISNDSSSVEPVTVPTVRDQGVAARGKRHGSKGHKGMGNNRDPDQKKSYSVETDKNYTQSSNSDNFQRELSAPSKENRGTGERSMSHWQPKAQAFSTSNQRGNRPDICQNDAAEGAWANKMESGRRDEVLPPPIHDTDTNNSSAQIHHDRSVSERNNAEEAPNVRQQEPRRERKTASLKGNPHMPNQGPSNPVEPQPVNLDARHEQHMSGFRKSGNQNNRFSKSQESRGDWNHSEQDNKQHNPPPNRERQRQNSHYEYQPVGTYNNRSSNSDGPKDGTDNSGARVRGRGQNHSRRGGGNFYGRQSGVRVDASYD